MPTCVQCGFDNVETVRVCDLCDEPVPRTAAAVIGTVSRTTSALAAPPPFMLLKKLQDDVRILLQRTQEQERTPQLQGRPPPAGGALSQEAKRRAVRPPHSGLAQTGGAMPSRAEPPNKKRPRPVPDSTPLAGSVLSFTPSEPLRGPSASEPPPQSSSRPHTDPPIASAPSERAKSPALRLYHEYVSAEGKTRTLISNWGGTMSVEWVSVDGDNTTGCVTIVESPQAHKDPQRRAHPRVNLREWNAMASATTQGEWTTAIAELRRLHPGYVMNRSVNRSISSV